MQPNPSPKASAQHTPKRHVHCTFYPNSLMSAFYVPEVKVDGGVTRDPVDVACKFYLLWQAEYSESGAVHLCVDGDPEMSAILGKALFGRKATEHAA